MDGGFTMEVDKENMHKYKLVVNAGFSRRVRKGTGRVGRVCIESKNVIGITIHGVPWDTDHQPTIRGEVMKRKPKGDGWVLNGYALIGCYVDGVDATILSGWVDGEGRDAS